MSGAALPSRGELSVAALPGGAEPFAGRVGWKGLPLRTNYRRGQRLPTDIRLPPAPRVSAGLRFAVRSLSEASDRGTTKSGACVGTSSTAERSPFPSRGRLKRARSWSTPSNVGRGYCLLPIAYCLQMAGANSSLLIPHLNQKDCRFHGSLFGLF